MYSPKERIYNTPELSGGVGNSVLMQLRLESILRKYGRLPCCEPYVYSSKPVALPELQKPRRIARPLNDVRLYERYRRSYDSSSIAPNTIKRETSEKFKPCGYSEQVETESERKKRSAIPGAPPDDPYLQRQRETVSGCKYGGVNLSVFRANKPKPEMFQPFYPQKSPLRLPCIQREKSSIKEICDQSAPLTDRDLAKHVRILEKQRTREITKHKINANKKKNKKARREQEFHRWEQSQDKYLQQVQSLDSDHQILKNLEKFHETERPAEEHTQRLRISEEIRKGVQRKLNLFREDDNRTKEQHIPVCNVQFLTDTETYNQDKTTVHIEKRTRKSKNKQSKKKKIQAK